MALSGIFDLCMATEIPVPHCPPKEGSWVRIPPDAPYKSSTYQKSLATSHLSWVHGGCSKPKGKPRPESLRRGFFMPASSNVCRQRQQDNRVACAAPGKLDPRFPFSSRPSRAFLILRIPYQAHRWMQLRDLSPSSRARPHCGFPGSSSLVPLRRGLGSM